MALMVEISPGELIDKITVLEIKLERIKDAAKRENVKIEHDLLRGIHDKNVASNETLAHLTAQLREINGRLWLIEDEIRDMERAKDFGPAFVALARSVYRTNDERAAVKRLINDQMNSHLVEEKSYTAY